MQIYKIQNLTYYYPESNHAAVEDISLSIDEGELIFLTGYSGCGKSSLLKTLAGLLPEFYGGRIGGTVEYRGKDMRKWDKKELPKEIGMVFQDPEQQTCMTVVEHEVAFGLENLGVPRDEMHHRVAEALAMLDLTHLKNRNIFELSSGQKQRVILASILAMHPKVLILDEPTSQLDPIAANEILDYIHRLNREWGTTIILSEQRIERCFDMADRILIMDKGRLIFDGTPREATIEWDDTLEVFFPPITKAFRAADIYPVPINVKEGRERIKDIDYDRVDISFPIDSSRSHNSCNMLVEGRKIGYTYPNDNFAIESIDFNFYSGEVVAILGENGAGKSTLLKLISGVLKPQKGKINTKASIGYLSQDPNDYLFSDTVYDQLLFALNLKNMTDDGNIDKMLKRLQLYECKDENPRDLSGGQKQRVAIATVMITNPSVILMDEPTRGMDNLVKQELALIIDSLIKEGKCIIMVTHDIEFAAQISHRMLIMANGDIVANGDTRSIIGSSFFYSTQISRLFRGSNSNIVNEREAIALLQSITGKECI